MSDIKARLTAMTALDRTLVVEAGAGSGKTALMAARVVMLLASGVAPRSIAAITFTELAASELLSRVREYVEKVISGAIPREMEIVADRFDEAARHHLGIALESIDAIACTTIHGFCQRLVTPFPSEAAIDPGAGIIDPFEADRLFDDVLDAWLRERLENTQASPLLAELVLSDAGQAIKTVREIADGMRGPVPVRAAPGDQHRDTAQTFIKAADAFAECLAGCPVEDDATKECADVLLRIAADVREAIATLTGPAAAARIVTMEQDAILFTDAGPPRQLRRKTAWQQAGASVGVSKASAAALFETAKGHYDAATEALVNLQRHAASSVLEGLVGELSEVLDGFQERKRKAAFLDFDDLLVSARNLLRNDPVARRILAERYRHVLVDEFQDTDPVQAEIVWRLCGEHDDAASDWRDVRLREGALFVVGDPKQAIYRFRGADVGTYVAARDAIASHQPDALLSISANFRSCRSILEYANQRFETPLASDGQPGFTPLDASIDDHGQGPCIAALPVTLPPEGKSDDRRDAEAEAIADLCERAIGSVMVRDRQGGLRACRPGDIALLAPSSTDLWRYEEALEKRDISVATQAGKGYFLRQEVKDMIALVRILADPNDAMAIGAFLRGPLVGLPDEQLLDLVEDLAGDDPEAPRRLHIPRAGSPELMRIANEHARAMLTTLAALVRQARSTTPHRILSEAVEELRIRAILASRHGGRAERALANIDLFLEEARAYAVRGLRALADWAMKAWSDKARAIEGRPDAQEEAVALVTMHAAKGLEWPIVIPINSWGTAKGVSGPVIDRSTATIHAKCFGVATMGYEEAAEQEKDEIDRERVRLWYVGVTRARDYLLIPRHDGKPSRNMWCAYVDLDLDGLDEFVVPATALSTDGVGPAAESQSYDVFRDEAHRIALACPSLVWQTPSRSEGDADMSTVEAMPLTSSTAVVSDTASDTSFDTPAVVGGPARGSIIHKLIEEILTGELDEDLDAVTARAADLATALKGADHDIDTAEAAQAALSGLAIPEVQALRPRLVPEVPVYRIVETPDGTQTITVGIADAVAYRENGKPETVIDWKSDIELDDRMIMRYGEQVRAYAEILGADNALIAYVDYRTTNSVVYISVVRR